MTAVALAPVLAGTPEGRQTAGLIPPPSPAFFMNMADLRFWYDSALSDAFLARNGLATQPAAAFDALYSGRSDPYGNFTPRYRYQRRKYEHLLSMIPARRYRAALDVGCGLGVFTEKLAPYADTVVGLDVSRIAVMRATEREGRPANVTFEAGDMAGSGPYGNRRFDLVILMDVIYYLNTLTDEALKATIASLLVALTDDAVILLANHYFFKADEGSRITRRIHDAFRWASGLKLVNERRFPFYLSSVLQYSPG